MTSANIQQNSIFMENQRSIPLHVPLALAFGIPAALVLQQVRYWMNIHKEAESGKPEADREHFRMGRWWVYNSYENWNKANFIFTSVNTIERAIGRLEDCGVLLSANFNKLPMDQTKWYTIDFEATDRLVTQAIDEYEAREREKTERKAAKRPSPQNGEMASPSPQNGEMGEGESHRPKMGKPIPKNTGTTKNTIRAKRGASADKVDIQGRKIDRNHPDWSPFWEAVLKAKNRKVEELTDQNKKQLAKVLVELIKPCIYEPADLEYFAKYAAENQWTQWTVQAMPKHIADVRAARLAKTTGAGGQKVDPSIVQTHQLRNYTQH